MPVNLAVKRTFRIDEQEYESLDAMPPETRAAVEKALASSSSVSSKIGAKLTVSGRTCSSVDELPSILRPIVRGAVAIAATQASMNTSHGAAPADAADSREPLRSEPLVSPRVIAEIALFLLVLLLLRFGLEW